MTTSVPFNERLRSVQETTGSILCIGLDTDPARMPDVVRSADDPVFEFNAAIIRATQDLVCAYKLNLAFYEAAGEKGMRSLRRTLAVIPAPVLTIGDGKRGDIGNTAECYARSLREDLGFNASTVNPYMGSDAVAPFLTRPDHGAFLLALTSNPGAKDFQYLVARGKRLYEHIAARAKRWNSNRNCGLVVGATRPAELKRIRAIAPDLPILIPGVGAQGGDLRAAIRYGSDETGFLAVINVSRSVIYASGDDDFAQAARAEASRLVESITEVRRSTFRSVR